MPLFIGDIRVRCSTCKTGSRIYPIPIYAKTAKQAMAYMRKTDEWKDDGAFDLGENDKRLPVRARQVLNPKEVRDWDADVLCWEAHEDDKEIYEVTIVQAFFDEEYRSKRPKMDSAKRHPTEAEEAGYDKACDEYDEWTEKKTLEFIALQAKR